MYWIINYIYIYIHIYWLLIEKNVKLPLNFLLIHLFYFIENRTDERDLYLTSRLILSREEFLIPPLPHRDKAAQLKACPSCWGVIARCIGEPCDCCLTLLFLALRIETLQYKGGFTRQSNAGDGYSQPANDEGNLQHQLVRSA